MAFVLREANGGRFANKFRKFADLNDLLDLRTFRKCDAQVNGSTDNDLKEIKDVLLEQTPVNLTANFDMGKPPAELITRQFSRSHTSVTQTG